MIEGMAIIIFVLILTNIITAIQLISYVSKFIQYDGEIEITHSFKDGAIRPIWRFSFSKRYKDLLEDKYIVLKLMKKEDVDPEQIAHDILFSNG